MADIVLDNEAAPSAPASGKVILYNDSVSLVPAFRTSAKAASFGVRNASVAVQAYTTAEIYLTGSALTIPSHLLQVGTTLRWRGVLTKTAGTAAPVFIIRLGTAGTTSDTARHTFTGFATPSSATDTAWVDIEMIVRTIGAAATSVGSIRMAHQLAATGFANLDHAVQTVSTGTFDSTVAALIAGVTFNHSTAGAGNIEQVTAELVN
jgi:hypothetical protein